MRIICLLTILSLSLLFVGCSSDDLVAVDEQPTHIPAGAYEEECKWIYAQMNHDYLWREDLPDSASCDYGTDPVTFFKSLLSDKDRFSYCERNTSYSPPAEIVNMGFEYQMYSSGADEFAQVLYVTSQELKRQGLRRGSSAASCVETISSPPTLWRPWSRKDRRQPYTLIPSITWSRRRWATCVTLSLTTRRTFYPY